MTLSKSYDFVKPQSTTAVALLGNGLVFAEGDVHKRQRKMMNPAFIHSNIKVIILYLYFHCKKINFESSLYNTFISI